MNESFAFLHLEAPPKRVVMYTKRMILFDSSDEKLMMDNVIRAADLNDRKSRGVIACDSRNSSQFFKRGFTS